MPLTGKELKLFASKIPDDATIEHEVDDEWADLESCEIQFRATAEDVLTTEEDK